VRLAEGSGHSARRPVTSNCAIDALLDDARRHLCRLTPEEACRATRHGAALIDTRPAEQRDRDGTIPGAILIDRNVLEWRLDPTSPYKSTSVADDQQVIIICNEGYSSSLAAATLQGLGRSNATDVVGGFQNWIACGLPVTH
jgi:rhodanese-related sulfurtransferase